MGLRELLGKREYSAGLAGSTVCSGHTLRLCAATGSRTETETKRETEKLRKRKTGKETHREAERQKW